MATINASLHLQNAITTTTTSPHIHHLHHHHNHQHQHQHQQRIPFHQSTPILVMLNFTVLSSAHAVDPSAWGTSSFTHAPPKVKVKTGGVEPAIRMVWLIFGPVIFVVGVCGNVFVLLIMTRKIMGGTSTCVHSSVMAIADLTVTVVGLTPEWFEICFDAAFKNVHPIACKLEKFFFYTAADVSVWTLVIFTLDRYVAVCHPLKKRAVCTTQRARIFAAAVVLTALGKNAHVFWTRGVQYAEDRLVVKKLCGTTDPDYEYFEKYVRSWIVFVFVNVLPAIIISICNFFIVRSMFRMNRKSSAVPLGRASPTAEASTPRPSPKQPSNLSRHSIATPSDQYLQLPIKTAAILSASSSSSLMPPSYSSFSPSPGQRFLARTSLSVPGFKERSRSPSALLHSIVINVGSNNNNTGGGGGGGASSAVVGHNNKALIQMTAMCLAASICFLVCNTPSVVLYVGREYWEKNQGYVVFKPLYNIFVYVNHAINFLLYCLTGQRFRRVFADLFCRSGYRRERKASRRYSDWGDNSLNVASSRQQQAGAAAAAAAAMGQRKFISKEVEERQARKNAVLRSKTQLYEIEEDTG